MKRTLQVLSLAQTTITRWELFTLWKFAFPSGGCILQFEMSKLITKGVRRLSFIVGLGFPPLYIMYKEKEISNFRQNMELKINDKVVPVPEKLQTLVEEVIKEMGTNTEETPEVTAFICKGNDLKHTNRTWWSTHIFLGIPHHYMYEDSSQFSLVTDGKEVTKEKPEEVLLKECMCLSKEAKKYSIANALYEGIDEKFLYSMLLTPFILLKCIGISFFLDYLSQKMKTFRPGLKYHAVGYFCGIWVFILVNDLNSLWKEGMATALPTELGETYMKGGLEYYNKILERNKVLRTSDKRSYSRSGEVKTYPFGVCHMKFSTRLDYLKSINEGKENSLWRYVLFYF